MKKIYYQLLRKIQKKVRKNYGYRHLERGQVLVIVALSVIGLVAAVGLTVDVGLLYLNHGKLRRAVDAAALAATAQFREGYSTTDLENAAVEFLKLNGINDPGAKVETCESNPGDPVLCVDYRGQGQEVIVGRMKIERRPLLLVVAETEVGEITTMVQNAETIRLTTPAGEPRSVVSLEKGSEVLVALESPGRHFGHKVEETIWEK